MFGSHPVPVLRVIGGDAEGIGAAAAIIGSDGSGVYVEDSPDARALAAAHGWDMEIDGTAHRARLRALVHPHLRDVPMFQIDWRQWPSSTGEKTVPVLTWGEGANAGDIVAREWYLLSQVTVSAGAPTVANAGEAPFAHDDIEYWTPEGPAGPSGRDTVVTLYAEDGSVFGTRTISKPYSLEDSKRAAQRRRDRVWSEIENLLLGLLLMGGMDGTAAGAESQRLKEAIGLTAIDAFRSANAMAQPLRDGLDAAQTGGDFPWLDTVVSAAGDVVATVKGKLVRWPV